MSGTDAGEHNDFHFMAFIRRGRGKTCCHGLYWPAILSPSVGFDGFRTVNQGDRAVVGESVLGSVVTDSDNNLDLEALRLSLDFNFTIVGSSPAFPFAAVPS